MKTRLYLALLILSTASGYAQLNRTAVSITGLDTNDCSVATPCRSFSQAISRTNSGGEVIALDSGGYGAFTVDRSMTVLAAPGIQAGITVTSFVDAVTVQHTSGSVVLRGLSISGLGVGRAGIETSLATGSLHVEKCSMSGLYYGIVTRTQTVVTDTRISNTSHEGITFANNTAPVSGTVNRVSLKYVGTGVYVGMNANVSVRDTTVIRTANYGFSVADNGVLQLESCLVTQAGIAGVGVFTGAVGRVSNTVVVDSASGFIGLGTIYTFQNNKIAGNTVDVNGSTLTPVVTD